MAAFEGATRTSGSTTWTFAQRHAPRAIAAHQHARALPPRAIMLARRLGRLPKIPLVSFAQAEPEHSKNARPASSALEAASRQDVPATLSSGTHDAGTALTNSGRSCAPLLWGPDKAKVWLLTAALLRRVKQMLTGYSPAAPAPR